MSNHGKALSGQSAFVSASTRGPGRKVAETWGLAGARVALHYRHDRTGAEDSFRRFKADGAKGLLLRADLSDEGQWEILADTFRRELGGLDRVCLNLAVREDSARAGDWRAALEMSLRHLPGLAKGGKTPALWLLVPDSSEGAWAQELAAAVGETLRGAGIAASFLPVRREAGGGWSDETLAGLESRVF